MHYDILFDLRVGRLILLVVFTHSLDFLIRLLQSLYHPFIVEIKVSLQCSHSHRVHVDMLFQPEKKFEGRRFEQKEINPFLPVN